MTFQFEQQYAIRPFDQLIWKIVSRCNLNCTYCYMYNLADKRWQQQPKLMSAEVASTAAFRALEHCQKYNRRIMRIVFHGGEPLLGGVEHLRMLVSILEDTFAGSGIEISKFIQSNGLPFNEEIGNFLLEKNIYIGVSIDGPPEINDKYRIDFMSNPSSHTLEQKLAVLSSTKYRKIFSGLLCVIHVEADPLEVFRYLMRYNPPSIHFILPDCNHDFRPPGKEKDIDATPYGDWLIKIFDYWYENTHGISIRLFESIIRLIVGNEWIPEPSDLREMLSLSEEIGLSPVCLAVIETNGDIEAVDMLKSTYEGATMLGYNIFRNDLDSVATHKAIRSRQVGKDGLCQKCQDCPVVNICGGGYLPHRYSSENGFDNPSVYSADLEKLIRHIHKKVSPELRAAGINITDLKEKSEKT